MDLYIIRHAQSTNNALPDQTYRVCDPDLTDLGWRQVERLAQHLANETVRDLILSPSASTAGPGNGHGAPFDRLYCSPMRRALQTAGPLAKVLGLTPEVWVDIHEQGGMWLDHGAETGIVGYPGITRPALLSEFPGCVIPETLTDYGWWQRGHEEETEAATRAAQVAAVLRSRRNNHERIALITHGAFAMLLFRALLGQAPDSEVCYHLDNTGISLIRFRANGTLSVRYLNRLNHLPPEMMS
jgi:2,3-bisphosphoglycerate-dependent phosphoglycerate mutase